MNSQIKNGTVALLLCLFALGLFAISMKVTGPQLAWDGRDYAQVARQIARGEGQTTKVLYSYLLPQMADVKQWPNLFRPPFPVFLMSLGFRAFGVSELTAVLWSGLFYVGTVVMIFVCFQRVFGAEVAVLSAITFALSRCGLVYARSALTEPSAMVFLLVGFMLIVTTEAYISAFVGGMSLGLAALNRPIAGLWVMVMIAYAVLHMRQIKRPAWMLGGFLLPVMAAMYAFRWEGGRALLGFNLAFRVGNQAEGAANPLGFVLHHSFGLLSKFAYEMSRAVVYLFQAGNVTLFAALSIFAFALPTQIPVQRKARNITMALILFTALAQAFLTQGDTFVGPLRYFDVFVPLLIPWGMYALITLVKPAPKVAVIALLCVYWAGAGFQAIRDSSAQRYVAEKAVYSELSHLVPSGEIIAASASVEAPAIAWYADRRAIHAGTAEVLPVLDQRGIRVAWYFSKEDDTPTGFRLVKRWDGGYSLSKADNSSP